MREAFYYIWIVAKNSVEQKKKIVFQMVNHAVFLLFSLYLYKYVYELLPAMHDKLPFPNAVWSMSMYFVAFWLGLRNIEKTFRDDITSGNIELYLLRPMGYVWQKVLIQIGRGLVPFICALLLSVIIDYAFLGLPEMQMSVPLWILALIVIFILSQILTCLIYILCGLTGFWLQDSQTVYFVVSKFIMIFGGAWVPVAFFPEILQLIAIYSPFGASAALTFAMYPDFHARFWILCTTIIVWIVVGLFAVHVMSTRAARKLSVNG